MEEKNYGIKCNALKYQNSGVMSIKGRTGTKRCLVIPIEENHLYVSANADGTAKAVYLDFNAYALREPKYDQTHLMKQSLPKEIRESMTKEQLEAMPIFGGLTPFNNTATNAATTCDAPLVQPQNEDDLPF